MQPLLPWLPASENWKAQLRDLPGTDARDTWQRLVALANARLDFLQTVMLDKALAKHFPNANPPPTDLKPFRLAILASSTVEHLLAGIRVSALRRSIWCTTYTGEYGQYMQDLISPSSHLNDFAPSAILIALDSHHLAGSDPRQESPVRAEESLALLKRLWSAARNRFNCPIIQQTLLPVFHPVVGANEHRLPSSPSAVVQQLNERIRTSVDEYGVHLLSLDEACAAHGLREWHDVGLWHHAKQEICPAMAPLYGDLVGRLLAALQGQSKKCLVLDLDNTLWGGVIGDDGVSGISLGQNSALGEAYVEFQKYVLQLSRRGIILAVCSKNDEANARCPFEQHSEMVLRLSDIACFRANWQDKASNIRMIAKTLNIGLDSLVFVDDSPFERNQVRAELPMVAVPELPDDPAFYSATISAAGYFEAVALTDEDKTRTAQYQENVKRQQLLDSSSDLDSYLRSLEMRLIGEPFDLNSIKRATQLINKTNQFNLTTRRYREEDIERLAVDPCHLTLQLRLIDSLGDSGIISVVIGRLQGKEMWLDTWLMSCRVLGRKVEESTFNMVAERAAALGASCLLGQYVPSAKNAMVRDFYEHLGFTKLAENPDGSVSWRFHLAGFVPRSTFIREEYSHAQLAS